MAVAASFVAAVATFAAEDWRGNNRLSGVVVDKNSGKGVAKATVKLRIRKGGQGGPDVTTDGNGKWAVLGLSAGAWNIDVEALGYITRQLSTGMQEGQRLPPMKIEIEPQPVRQPEPAAAEVPREEVRIGGTTVTREIAEAIEAGNNFLKEAKYKEAVEQYEKAYPTLSSNIALKFALARAYYGAGQIKKGIVLLDEAYKADPTNTQTAMLLANMLLEDGQLEAGQKIIDSLPAEGINLDSLLNMGIVLMNKKQPAAAAGYFTKAIALAPTTADGYYYRGLATIQMGKARQAKPDLEKVLELAPDSNLAKDAKEYLKSIK